LSSVFCDEYICRFIWQKPPSCYESNSDLTAKLREVFAEWFGNGHTDENDPNTCILRVRLTDGALMSHGTRYEIDFSREVVL
jgi:hypothetical protein